jgi:hypothetical protein
VQRFQLFRCEGDSLRLEIGDDLRRAFLGSQQSEVGQTPRYEITQQWHIVYVVMSHDNSQRITRRVNRTNYLSRRRNNDRVGLWKACRRRKVHAAVSDGYVPAQFLGKSYKRLGIVASAENQESRRWIDVIMENLRRVRDRGEFLAEVSAKQCRVFCLPHDRQPSNSMGAETLGQRTGPERPRRKWLNEDFDDPVAAQADAPN